VLSVDASVICVRPTAGAAGEIAIRFSPNGGAEVDVPVGTQRHLSYDGESIPLCAAYEVPAGVTTVTVTVVFRSDRDAPGIAIGGGSCIRANVFRLPAGTSVNHV
jgi:hypothetical protein